MTSSAIPSNIHQIVDKSGKPAPAVATNSLWVAYHDNEFGYPTPGNKVTPFFSGKAYFAALIKAIEGAEKEIYIAGWQVNWDALLSRGVRLFDVLYKRAKAAPALKIYVMPWNDSAPVQTFDDQTVTVLSLLNEMVRPGLVSIFLADGLADVSRAFFSHHQKQVVIDRKIAFIGGIDVAYGRFDDENYDLTANAEGREGLNRYNGCVVAAGEMAESKIVDPDKLEGGYDRVAKIPFMGHKTNAELTKQRISAGGWQTQYGDDNPAAELTPVYRLPSSAATLDPATQPRMPWQDVHVQIEGAAVAELTRNFVIRWNAQSEQKALRIPATTLQEPAGKCQIQVLRSAPGAMRALESRHNSQLKHGTHAQDDIYRAMLRLIKHAENFIYIENQFFVSGFGTDSESGVPFSAPLKHLDESASGLSPSHSAAASRMAGGSASSAELPKNEICAELGNRIDVAIQRGLPFHVVITLPVHPEGLLNAPAVITQVHWTMQSLVFGSQSLLSRVRRSLLAKKLRKEKHPNPKIAYDTANSLYQSIPIEACAPYVTLLNLRNWKKQGDRYITEQIYVHSKLMVVDDRYAILGSANVNDRSLLGTRDSEIAVLIIDDDVINADVRGNGKPIPVRRFAHELRRGIWSKLFGIAGNVRPASELQYAVDHPASPKSWKLIQTVASQNASLYEAAFGFIPRNKDPNDAEGERPASIWPVWDRDQKADYPNRNKMPFEADFWKGPQHFAAGAAGLSKVRGFITALPIEWTKGENNNVGFHTRLVVDRGTLPPEAEQPGGDPTVAKSAVA